MRVSGRVARVALAIGLTTALAACGGSGDGGVGPGGRASLDPTVIGPRADRMAALTTQPVMAALLAQGSALGLPAFQRSIAGIERALVPALYRATPMGATLVRSTRGTRASLGAAPTRLSATTGASSLVPDSLLGRTLVLNAQGHYVVDPTRTGAPATGVRFVIFTPGTTQEIGHADLTDQITSPTELTVIDVVAGTTVVMHNATVITTSSTGEDDTSRGYLTNGTDRVDFNFVMSTTYRPVEDRTTGVLTIASPGIGISMIDSLVASGLAAADQQVGRLTVGNTTVRTVTSSVGDASSGYVPSDTTRVTVNGTSYATIVTGATGTSFLAPDGSPLSASDRSALASVQQIAAASIGFVLAELIVLFWLFDATGL